MLLKIKEKKFIKKFNYKDILIIFFSWFIIVSLIYIIKDQPLEHAPFFSGLINYLFVFSGRFLYLALIILYLISLYTISFTELGLKPNNFKKELYTGIYLSLFLLLFILIFINLPLSFQNINSSFNPLFEITNVQRLILSLLFLLLLLIPNTIIALSEQFILNNIVFELFNFKLNTISAVILSCFFYSFFMLTFTPQKILINFIIALISIYLYLKTEGSLYLPTFFLAFNYSINICFIYGWDYLQF